jgi:hypothetical protein
VRLDEARRIKEWNLDCAGKLGISSSAYVVDNGAATFYDVDRTNGVGNITLVIRGDVEVGFAEKLRQAIKLNPDVEFIGLGSGGGSVSEALEAGRLIRRLKLKTMLWNNCNSACTLVFFGGVERLIWSPYPDLGFHMVSRNGIAEPTSSGVYEKIGRYATEMDVDPRAVISAMLAAAPNELHYLRQEKLCKAAIATWVQRACSQND